MGSAPTKEEEEREEHTEDKEEPMYNSPWDGPDPTATAPNEVMFLILLHLDPVSLCRLATVNKRWKQLVEDDGHWRRHYKHYVNTGFRSTEHDASKPWLGFNLTDEVPPDQGGYKAELKKLTLVLNIKQRRKVSRSKQYSKTRITGHRDEISCMDISSDGLRVLTGSREGQLYLWNTSHLDSPAALTSIANAPGLMAAAISPGVHLIAAGGTSQSVALYTIKEASRAFAFEEMTSSWIAAIHPHTPYITSIKFVGDERLLSLGRRVNLWDVETQQHIWYTSTPPSEYLCMAVSPVDENLMAVGDKDGYASIFDLRVRERVGLFYEDNGALHGIDFSPNGTGLATAYQSCSSCIFDTRTCTPCLELGGGAEGKKGGKEPAKKNPQKKIAEYDCNELLSDGSGLACGFDSCCFSLDGSVLFLGCPDGGVYRWDTLKKQELAVMRGYEVTVNAVRASPDGRYLCSAGTNACTLWHFP